MLLCLVTLSFRIQVKGGSWFSLRSLTRDFSFLVEPFCPYTDCSVRPDVPNVRIRPLRRTLQRHLHRHDPTVKTPAGPKKTVFGSINFILRLEISDLWLVHASATGWRSGFTTTSPMKQAPTRRRCGAPAAGPYRSSISWTRRWTRQWNHVSASSARSPFGSAAETLLWSTACFGFTSCYETRVLRLFRTRRSSAFCASPFPRALIVSHSSPYFIF